MLVQPPCLRLSAAIEVAIWGTLQPRLGDGMQPRTPTLRDWMHYHITTRKPDLRCRCRVKVEMQSRWCHNDPGSWVQSMRTNGCRILATGFHVAVVSAGLLEGAWPPGPKSGTVRSAGCGTLPFDVPDDGAREWAATKRR
jgi:hypothetical protein